MEENQTQTDEAQAKQEGARPSTGASITKPGACTSQVSVIWECQQLMQKTSSTEAVNDNDKATVTLANL